MKIQNLAKIENLIGNIFVNCKSAIFMDMPLYWYRVNKDSATKGKASWRKTDLLTAVKRIEKYLEEQECGIFKRV